MVNGVSTLESMALTLGAFGGTVCPVMDARRSQVYNALFVAENGALSRLTEDRAIALEELAQELQTAPQPIFLVGDGSELLDYAGNLNDPFEWCRFLGNANVPYLDPDEADRIRAENLEGAKQAAYRACQKEVVLDSLSVENCTVLMEYNNDYTGSEVYPPVTVIANDGTILQEGVDYTVRYGAPHEEFKSMTDVYYYWATINGSY